MFHRHTTLSFDQWTLDATAVRSCHLGEMLEEIQYSIWLITTQTNFRRQRTSPYLQFWNIFRRKNQKKHQEAPKPNQHFPSRNGWDWCRLGAQCPSSYDKYRRVLRCHTWWSHPCVPTRNGRTRPFWRMKAGVEMHEPVVAKLYQRYMIHMSLWATLHSIVEQYRFYMVLQFLEASGIMIGSC